MKLTLATLALVAFANVPAFADGVVNGCAVKDMGGYSNKVDPTCEFTGLSTGAGGLTENASRLDN